MPHDFVFFTEDHSTKPLTLLTPLSHEELIARRKKTGWRTHANVKMPLREPDAKTDKEGSFIIRNFLGSDVQPSELTTDPNVLLGSLEPGLVVGDFKPEYFQTEDFKKRAQAAVKREQAEYERLMELRAQVANDDPEIVRRYYRVAAAIAGVPDPDRLPEDLLKDVAFAAVLTNRLPIPDLDVWRLFVGATSQPAEKPFEPLKFNTLAEIRNHNMQLDISGKSSVKLGNRLRNKALREKAA